MARKQKKSNYRKSSRAKKSPAVLRLRKASRLWLPWPVFAFLMLAVGVLLIGATFRAGALDYSVTGRVPALPPTEPANINSPLDGQRFTVAPISVSGTCPSDSYVNIYRNNLYGGSALCSGNRFSLQVDLFEGANELQARVFSFTDAEGPASPPITVYYDKPVPVDGETGEPKPPVNAPPFLLKTEFRLRGYYVDQTVKLQLELSGGTPPYALEVDWGDGKRDLLSQKSEGKLVLQHQYKIAATGEGDFTVKINGTDSEGQKAYLQMFLIVNSKEVPLSPGIISGISPPSLFSRELLKYVWPAYVTVGLMALSFWLGEREELLMLRRHAVPRRHH